MQVTRLQLGVYANQQPFCLYLLPLASSSDVVHSPTPAGSSSPRQPIAQYLPFYRLRDIDCIFFESGPGYVLNSGKIPQIYFDTPGYCFRERSDDVYLAARALRETATRLGNHLLAEFCKLGKDELLSGTADHLLNNVSIKRTDFIEAQFEFIAVDTKSPSPSQSESLPSAPSSGHLSPPQVNTRKRMSLEDILDKDDSHDRRGSTMIKQEQSPPYSGSDNSSPTSPNHMPRSPHSPSSPNSTTTDLSVLIDDDTRMRKKRRVANSSITSNNIRVTNNPEVMEQVRNTLKLKQQQKAIIEARQHQAQVDRRHSVAVTRMTSQGACDGSKTAMSKRNSVSTHNRNNRNSRNLSVFAPPYNGQTSVTASPHFSPTRGFSDQQNSQRHDSPMITPITPTMINRPVSRMSVSGYPLSANSAFRPIQNMHPASTSANINGLISPKNTEFQSSSSSLGRSSPSSTSPMSQLHDFAEGDQANKESFINLFDSFYDTLADSRQLKATLEEQIRKSATLMQTLQTSGVMIESLVRDNFQDMQREVVRDLMMLEKRISRVEAHVRHSPTVRTASPPIDADRRLSNISTASSDMGYPHRNNSFSSNSNAGSPYTPPQSQHHLHPSGASPPLSASIRSEVDGSHSKDYEGVLSALKARLESLERRMSVS